MMDLLEGVSTDALIALLSRRSLTPQNVAALQLLRPAETTSSSQAVIATGGPKEIKSSAEKFAKAVVRKNVQGKLPVGSKINGVEINWSYAGGFYNHGPDQMRPSPLENNVTQLCTTIYSNQDKLFSSLEKHQYQQGPYGTGDAFQSR